jgi:hypothetical protein
MIGYVQGLQSIVDAVVNIVHVVISTTPSSSAYIGNYISGYVQQAINPAQGAYWEFGIILAVGGFILIARGDRKPKGSEPQEL